MTGIVGCGQQLEQGMAIVEAGYRRRHRLSPRSWLVLRVHIYLQISSEEVKGRPHHLHLCQVPTYEMSKQSALPFCLFNSRELLALC